MEKKQQQHKFNVSKTGLSMEWKGLTKPYDLIFSVSKYVGRKLSLFHFISFICFSIPYN